MIGFIKGTRRDAGPLFLVNIFEHCSVLRNEELRIKS